MSRLHRAAFPAVALRALLLAGCVLLAACASNPRGKVSALAPARAAPAPARVILLRGWMGLSPGLDPLAATLRAEGFEAAVFRHNQWPEIAAELRRPGAPHQPLVLIGHSFGADAALALAADLTRHGGVVALLVTLDPVLPSPVPAGVRACRNYYRSNGLRDVLPLFRGVPLHPAEGARVEIANLDLHGNRRDLLEADTDHFKITTNTRVNAAILGDVRAACTP